MNNEYLDPKVITHEELSYRDSTKNGENGKIISVSETAIILGMTPRNIRYLAKEGKIPYQTRKKGKRLIYLFNREDVEKYQKGKEIISPHGEGKGEGNNFTSSPFEQKILYPSQAEAMQKEIRELYMELGRWREKANNNQYLLEERAQSLYEKEARIKELEAKREEEKREIEGKIKEDEEQIKALEEKLKREHEEKEKYLKELFLKNLPWWKKAFYSKEKIEVEINREFKSVK